MSARMQDAELKRTPLYECHKQAGAKFVEFGGWEMPVQYTGLVDEHNAVRSAAGLFDVSHMGEVFVRGPEAKNFLQRVTSNNVAKLFPGKAQYSLLLNEQGGVVDDIIVYQLGEDDYLLCVNAANAEKDFRWLGKNNSEAAELVDASAEFAQIALQGPAAMQILAEFLDCPPAELSSEAFKPFTHRSIEHPSAAKPLLIARTGYTGEDGVEIFCPAAASPAVWDGLFAKGKAHGLQPAGLGARDTLRLEACYPLHGHELADDVSALESGLGWVAKLKKGEFIGRDVLVQQKASGTPRKLVGLEVTDRGIVRHGNELQNLDGESVGAVTSGTKPPTVDKAIGLALVSTEVSEVGTQLQADVRGRLVGVRVIPTPFYKRD